MYLDIERERDKEKTHNIIVNIFDKNYLLIMEQEHFFTTLSYFLRPKQNILSSVSVKHRLLKYLTSQLVNVPLCCHLYQHWRSNILNTKPNMYNVFDLFVSLGFLYLVLRLTWRTNHIFIICIRNIENPKGFSNF